MTRELRAGPSARGGKGTPHRNGAHPQRTQLLQDWLGRALPLCPAPPRLVAYLRGPPPLPVPYTAVRCAAEDGDAPPSDVAEALADVLQAQPGRVFWLGQGAYNHLVTGGPPPSHDQGIS